jgi:peptide/nickel transport system substrate-binding protein
MTGRATPLPVRVGATALIAAALMAPAGCGSSNDPVAGAGGSPGARDNLAWAIPDAPADLDPLFADTRSEQLVVRQLDEPLIERLAGPYGDVRRLPGLALSANPVAGATTWRLPLRAGVRFQDGTLFNASAVLANAERWRASPTGRALLPGLTAVDAPRPDLVRLFFDRATPKLPTQLSDPRLGIVSPRALEPDPAAELRHPERAGTGPFELRERGPSEVLVARNTGWWGTRHQLGPALDQVQFRMVPSAAERLTLLRRGEVQVADRLGPAEVRRLRGDPLLSALPGPRGTALGLERSVRGIDAATQIPSLSGAWLTRIGAG